MAFLDNTQNYSKARQDGEDNIIQSMRISCWITEAADTHSEDVCNRYCFSTATVVTRTLFSVTLYVLSLLCFNVSVAASHYPINRYSQCALTSEREISGCTPIRWSYCYIHGKYSELSKGTKNLWKLIALTFSLIKFHFFTVALYNNKTWIMTQNVLWAGHLLSKQGCRPNTTITALLWWWHTITYLHRTFVSHLG